MLKWVANYILEAIYTLGWPVQVYVCGTLCHVYVRKM